MFLNTSWSEWLKSPLSSITRADEERTLPSTELDDVSSTSSNRSKSFKEFYPEEGTVDFTSPCPDEQNLSSSNMPGGSTDYCFPSTHKNLSSFKRGLPFISSTPFSQSPVLKKASEDFVSESLMTESSTSKFLKEDRYTRTLLPTARKRLRDHSEEESCDDGNVCRKENKVGIIAHSPAQLFSEGETEVNSEMTRMVKRPRFSISAFGSPLQTRPSSPQEEESFQPVSIFYPGRIAFGGASNHHRRKLKIVPRKIVPHVATPVPSFDGGLNEGLSSVARRILHCIDKISTPLSVSKRALPFTAARDSSSFVADFHKYRPTLKSEVTTPPTNKLLIPAKVKIRKNISSLIEPETVPYSTSTNNARNCSMQSSYSKADILVKSVCKTSLPSVSPEITRERISSEPCKVPPSLFKVGKVLVPKDQVLEPSSDLPLSRSGFIPDDHKKPSQKGTDYSSILNPVTEAVGFSFRDESEQYQFCEPEVIFSVPCQESLMPMSAFDQTEFEFSMPLETVNMPVFKSMNSVDVSHDDCENKIKFSKGSLESDISTSQISKESTHLLSSSWGEAFKLPKGSWECQSCFLQNKEETSSCIACMTPKPLESKKSSAPVPQETKQHSSSWGDAFKPPSGMWECQVCLVQNKDNDTKCAACETPKSLSAKEQPTFTSFFATKEPSFKSASSMEVWQKKGFNDSWGDAFKPAKGSWECASCLVQNAERETTCVSCRSSKPNDLSSGKAPCKKESDSFHQGAFSNSLGQLQDNFKGNNTSWVCSKCILTNPNSEKICTRCKNPFPDISIDSTNSNRNQSSTGLKTLISGMPKNDSWCCETCFAWNKVAIQKCTSCGSPKLSLTPVSVSEAFTGNFQFGVKAQTSQQVKEAPLPTFTQPFLPTSSPSTAHTTPLSLPSQVLFPPLQSSVDEMKMPLPLNESKSPSDNADKKTVSQSEQSKFVWNMTASVASTGPSTSLFGNTMSCSSLKPHTKNEVPEKDKIQTVSKPSFQFSVTTPASVPHSEEVGTAAALAKSEFPKPEIKTPATMGFSFTPKEVSKPVTGINSMSSPKTFNFFQNSDKPFTFAPFNPPLNFGNTTTASKDTLGTITSATSTVPIVSSLPKTSFAFASPPPTSSSGSFAFGQNNSKPLSTGFNFGEAGAKQPAATFTFGGNSANKIFQFGQNSTANLNPPKLAEIEGPPSLLNMDMQKNPFTATPVAGGPQRRTIKRAYRRHK